MVGWCADYELTSFDGGQYSLSSFAAGLSNAASSVMTMRVTIHLAHTGIGSLSCSDNARKEAPPKCKACHPKADQFQSQ